MDRLNKIVLVEVTNSIAREEKEIKVLTEEFLRLEEAKFPAISEFILDKIKQGMINVNLGKIAVRKFK
jgi:hypothetical protein